MVECEFRKIYETHNKVGVSCTHPAHVEPKRITCDMVCVTCNGTFFNDRPVAVPDAEAEVDGGATDGEVEDQE